VKWTSIAAAGISRWGLRLSNAFNYPILAMHMPESLASITWQETVDTAITRLEVKTGLALTGLSQLEVSLQVPEWMKAKSEGRFQSESGS
jgi:hypothetical protein